MTARKNTSGVKDKAWPANGLGKEMREALNKSLAKRGLKVKMTSNFEPSKRGFKK